MSEDLYGLPVPQNLDLVSLARRYAANCSSGSLPIESVAQGAIQIDVSGRVVQINRCAREMTGYQVDDFKDPIWCLDPLVHATQVHDSTSTSVQMTPLHVALTQGLFIGGPVYMRHKKGHLFPVTACGVRLVGDHGEPNGLLEVFARNRTNFRRRAVEDIEDTSSATQPRRAIGFGSLLRLRDELLMAERHGQACGLLRVRLRDVSGLGKAVGYEGKTEALDVVLNTLSATLRATDQVLSWKGTRFAVLIRTSCEASLGVVQNRVRTLLGMVRFNWWGAPHNVECEVDLTVVSSKSKLEDLAAWIEE